MDTTREKMLREELKIISNKELISIKELENLIYTIEKLLLSFNDLELSRDNWKRKYLTLKKHKGGLK